MTGQWAVGNGQWAVGVGILSGCFCIVTKCSSAWRWVALWWVVDGCPFSRHGCSAARKSKQPLTAFNWHSNPLFMCCSKWTGGSVVVWSDWAHLECHISHIHIYQYPGHISICSHTYIYFRWLVCLKLTSPVCPVFCIQSYPTPPSHGHGQRGQGLAFCFGPLSAVLLRPGSLRPGRDFMFAYILSALLFVQFRATSPGQNDRESNRVSVVCLVSGIKSSIPLAVRC